MAEPKKKVSFRNAWQEARALIWRNRRRLAFGLVLMLVNRLAGLVLPTSSKYLIDNVLASGVKSGYSFALRSCAGTPITNYVSTGVPITVGQTGQRAFCSDQSGVIKFAADGTAASCTGGNTALQ